MAFNKQVEPGQNYKHLFVVSKAYHKLTHKIYRSLVKMFRLAWKTKHQVNRSTDSWMKFLNFKCHVKARKSSLYIYVQRIACFTVFCLLR